MRAVVVERFGGAAELILRDAPRPTPGIGELLVQVFAAGVNPVDAQNRSDGSWAGIEPPYVPGSDASGVVAGLGPRVRGFDLGDEVFYFSDFLGTRGGSYAEYQAVDASIVARKPSNISHVEAATVPLSAGTAYEVVRRLSLAAGEWCAIYGAAGGVGDFAVQLAVHAGAHVAAIARAVNHSRLKDLGAELTVDHTLGDVEDAIAAAVGEVDAVVDLVGREASASSLSLLRSEGRLAAVADLRGDLSLAIDKNITIHGVLVCPDGARLVHLADLLSRGLLRTNVGAVFPLQEAAAAHEFMEKGHSSGKVALRVVA